MASARLCCGGARYKFVLAAMSAAIVAAHTTSFHNSKQQCQKRQVTIVHTSPKRHDVLAPLLSRVMSTAASEGRPDDPKKRSVDDFIGSMFNSKRPFFPDLPPVDKIPARVAESFSSQIDSLQKSFDRFWEMLDMEDFRRLVDETVEEYKDAQLHPEIQRDAHVRQGAELSQGELEFLEKRKKRQRTAFAGFIGVDVSQVDERDIPVVGVAASGGGYRAMIGCAGYLKAMEDSGAMDMVTYIATVSGSCWTMAQYYSPLANASYDILLDHLKSHIHTHLANVTNFVAVLNASHENAKLLMQGMIERYYQLNGTVNLVDVFGMLLGGTLLTKKETISPRLLEKGQKEPYSEKISDTKVQAEDDESTIREEGGEKVKPRLLSRGSMALSAQAQYVMDGSRPYPVYCVVRHDTEEKGKDQEQIYQWFEFTPHEMGSEEINAWIPVWAFGRKFENGKNIERLPEQTLSIMMGTFGSAFAASLAHFYNEMRSFVPAAALDKADEMITRYRDSMSAYHPISPACFPNPFYRLDTLSDAKDIPGTERFLNSEHLCVADAGLDNNLPFYPLLRRGRNVDIILAIDLSADIQTAPHFDRAEGYARRRGIKGWPVGAGWPKQKSEIEAKAKASEKREYPLGTCTVFESTATQTTPNEFSHHPPNINPITIVYFPLIVNENYDPDFDPQTAEFCSTWNFVYSSSQVSKLTGLSAANWNDNVDQVRQVLRKTWERKRNERISRENETSQREIISIG